eukprot:TRINITY_DN63970_c0_g1_i1.p1 TRINITY_DN63970_c0_g1~~TRINITY_DN63970_c0_g1_i1.p1  ORF type:complete len:536 (+),score=74.97 TRINITY_DN63970_c0_g1_i1:32-1609(+)
MDTANQPLNKAAREHSSELIANSGQRVNINLDNVSCGAVNAVARSISAVDVEARVGSRAIMMNLVTGGLGTGMLSLPWAMAGASVVVGVFTIICVVALNFATIMILVHASEKFQAFDLAAVLGKLPGRLGPMMQILTNAMVWIALFGSLASYIIGMCDSASPFLRGSFLDHRIIVAGFSSLLVTPLCFLDQKYLSFSSTAAVLVNCYLMILVLSEFVRRSTQKTLPSETCVMGLTTGSLTMVSTAAQCIIIQMCVLPMYQEFEGRFQQPQAWSEPVDDVRNYADAIESHLGRPPHPEDKIKTRDGQEISFLQLTELANDISQSAFPIQIQARPLGPQKFAKVLMVAFSLLVLLFSAMATAGYLTFGENVQSNLLLSLPNDSAGQVAQAGMFLVLGAVYPIMMIAMIAPIKNMEPEKFGEGLAGKRKKSLVVTGATLLLIAASFGVALVVDSLGMVNVLDGALCMCFFTALVPGLVGLLLLERQSQLWRSFMYALLVGGFILGILGIVYTENNPDKLRSACNLPAR